MSDKRNIRIRYSGILEKIRNFMLSDKSREFLIFLFFAFVSFCFWLLQVLNDDYETELSIPVKMKNVPESVVMTSELPTELRFGVKDRGTVLANYKLGHTFLPITIDFSEFIGRGTHIQIPTQSLANRITSQLNQSTKISVIEPDTLEIIYMQGKGKKVPVQLQGAVKTERQYYISNITYSPDSVTVYAPNSILDTLQVAYTQPLDMENISDTLRQKLDIMPIKGARFIPSHSDITLMVDVYAERTLEVPVHGFGFPQDKVLRTFPSKVQVSFQVGLSHFKEVVPEDFIVEVDYKDLKDMDNEKCKPVLRVISPYVNHVRIHPQEIDYIIEQQGFQHD